MILSIYNFVINFVQTHLSNTSFQQIYDYIQTNFMSIVIFLGLTGVAITIANMIIRIIAVLVAILLCIKLFFLA